VVVGVNRRDDWWRLKVAAYGKDAGLDAGGGDGWVEPSDSMLI
jgi:hypothetical protein